MRKLKLLMAACALVGGVAVGWAQTAPFLQEKSDFSGATVSSLTTFVPSGTTYTLELTGCVASQEITVPGGSFSYMPTTNGTVRFVRNGGDVVYVYEGTTYKGTVSVSTPADPTFPDIYGDTDSSTDKTGIYSENNLFKNPGFETLGEKLSDHNYKAQNWEANGYSYGSKSRVRDNANLSGQEGSCTFMIHGYGSPAEYLSQQVEGLNNFTPYQVKMKIWFHEGAACTYTATVGTSIGNGALYSGEVATPGSGSADRTFTFNTDDLTGENYYFTLTRITDKRIGNFDRMTMVAATGGGIGITGATGATFLTGTAYAPEGVLAAALENGPIDVTSRVTNPNFDSNITGWTSYTNSSSNKVANNKTDYTTNFWENWNPTAKEGRMFHNNLPQGTYELQIYAFADQLGYMTPFSTAVAVYAQGQEVGTSSSDKVRPNYVNDINFAYYKSYAYVDETGKLEIGLRQYSPAQFRWLGIDNVTLKYIATDNQEEAKMLELYQAKWEAAKAILSDGNYSSVLGKERTDLVNALSATVSAYADYKTVADAAHTACQTFMSAKDVYAACATEYSHYQELSGTATYESFISSTRTATDVLNAIKEAEYVAVTTTYDTDGSALFIPSWDNTNFVGATGQHWSGNGATEYFDRWNGEAINCSISKTVTLPEGHYVFYAAGRGQANSASSVTLKVTYDETTLTQAYTMKGDTGYGISTDGKANFSASGEYANNGAGRGWEWRYIAFDLNTETSVTLSIEGTANNSWMSASDTKLLTYDNIAVTRQNYEAALAAAQAYQDDEMFTEDKASLNTAISDNTLTVATATQSELTTATENLNAAAAKAAADIVRYTTYTTAVSTINNGTNVDLTNLIGNPSFESTAAYALVADGWVNEGVGTQGQTNDGFGNNRVGNVFAERWANNTAIGAFKTYQTIDALPAGLYEVSVVASFNGTGASLVVNGATTAITDAATYSLLTQISDKGTIELGVQAVSPTGSWFMADNFQLKYVGEDFPVYTLASGKMGTDKAAAQTAAEAAFIENKTVSNYNALLAAIAEAEASKTNYAALKAAIDKAEAVKEANNFVTSDAATTFANEISTATAAWTDVTYTDAQATAEITTLGTAISGHRGNATGKAGNYIVSAWDTNTNGQTEGNWDGYYINTWSTEGDNDGSGFSVPFFEYYVNNDQNLPAKTMTATLTGLENGCYDVTIWARVQRRTDADFNGDNSMITMSVNDGEKVSIMSNTSNNVGTGGSTMRLGRYTARGMVTDGTLTLSIDVKLDANVHWLSWRDVKYTKVADESITVSDAGFATYVSDNDLNYSGVTGLTAYKATVSGNTITFETVTTVPAGEGVLLKGAGDTYSVPVTAGVAAWGAEENAFIRGTGAAVETGSGPYNYILNKVNGVIGFYRANNQIVATNRAYLQTTTNAARLNISFDDDDQTTGIARVEETVANDAVYTLSGVRVEKPTKGLYIKNGKKVVIK